MTAAWSMDPGARDLFWSEPARSERLARASSIPRESVEEYLDRGGVIRVITQEDADRSPLRAAEPQLRRAPSLRPENRKILKRQQRKAGTEEQRERAVQMLREGKTQREVSHAVGVSQWTVGQLAREMGAGSRKIGPLPSTTPEQEVEIARRLRAGETQRVIYEEMQCAPKAVRRVARQLGLQRKDAKGRPVKVVVS